ncbi:MAG: alcohol dehydrogenase catalytic domain-containing protein [Planctomycetota bacterium]
MRREIEAWEHRRDGGFDRVRLAFEGTEGGGWTIRRNEALDLELGPGYRLLDVRACGVCATDLARRHLPFPLPQVIGHEALLAEGDRRWVVEINASHASRGDPDGCVFCRSGLETHCPDRLVLGIDRLPGGFGDVLLAPRGALRAVPDDLPDDTAVLVEPFAAALHAVATSPPRDGDRVGVLGPRRLGMLLVAALAAWRRREGTDFRIAALPRRAELGALARALGADEVIAPDAPGAACDIVFDTTGHPDALPLAAALARRELHLKSTHGLGAGGLANPTAFVVDELRAERFTPDRAAGIVRAGGLGGTPGLLLAIGHAADGVDGVRRATDPRDAARVLAALAPPTGRADGVVATSVAAVDAAIRVEGGGEVGLVRPRGTILIDPRARGASPLLDAVIDRDVRVVASRCGDFSRALALLAGDTELRRLGERFVTDRYRRDELPAAFARAGAPDCLKVVVD